MKTIVNGWTITTEKGYGKPPDFKPMTFFCVVSPRVRTETRVDNDGLKLILPDDIYRAYRKDPTP